MPTLVSSGQDFRIWNFTLSTSDTQIVLNEKVNSLIIKCRTSVDLYLRRSGGDSEYFTIPAGSSLTLDILTSNLEPFALRAASGTPVAEIIGNK